MTQPTLSPADAARLAELRQGAEGAAKIMDFEGPFAFLIRLFDERADALDAAHAEIAGLTRDRNGWGDRCQELEAELARLRAPTTNEIRVTDLTRDGCSTSEAVPTAMEADLEAIARAIQAVRGPKENWNLVTQATRDLWFADARAVLPFITAAEERGRQAERDQWISKGASLPDQEHREWLGREVRNQWEQWAREQSNPKVSWTVPWDKLTEPEREVDRRIGDWLYRLGQRAARGERPAVVDKCQSESDADE